MATPLCYIAHQTLTVTQNPRANFHYPPPSSLLYSSQPLVTTSLFSTSMKPTF